MRVPFDDPRIGQSIRHYRLLEEIGRGGMSVVYRAFDAHSSREVAIKVLHPFLADKPDAKRRLAREAKTVSQLDHPHILKLYDYSAASEGSGELFIVCELVSGQTLRAFAEEHRIWETPELGALIIREIAQALAVAHQHKIVHRDLKAENIMVSQEGTLKLMDFGIAYVKDQESLTMTGTLLGSPAYMAPEIIEGKPSDFRSDIFSLSVLFYYLVTGELPFCGENPHTLLKNIVDSRFKSIEDVSAKVSHALRLVIEKGMAKDPDQRFQSAIKMAESIDEAFSHQAPCLKTVLSDPAHGIATLSATIHRSSLAQAQRFLDEHNFLLVAENLNRVLADDPTNEEALALLERCHTDSSKQKKKSRVPLIAGTALALGLCTSLVFTLTRPAAPASHLQTQKPIFMQALTQQAPAPKTTPVPDPAPAKFAPRASRTKLAVSVAPFADIWVDGKEIAKNASSAELMLEPGRHHVVFKHEFAATQQRTVQITKDSGPQTLHVDLERVKPATLVIKSNVDGDIAIDGVYKGTVREASKHPILVALPNKTPQKKLELLVSHPGFSPYVAMHTVVAGKAYAINVTMLPEGSATP